MHQNGYAGFWIRAAARIIDIFAILVVYWLFYLANKLGAVAGFLPPLPVEQAQAGEGFASIINVIRGFFVLGFIPFYFVWLHGTYGQTFGKMAMGIRIVNVDGSRLTYWQAFRRWMVEIVFGSVLGAFLLITLGLLWMVLNFVLGKIASFISIVRYLQDAFEWVVGLAIILLAPIPIAIMYAPAAFDPRKQGLHDRICHTLVIRHERQICGSAPSGEAFAPASEPDFPPAGSGEAPLDKGPEGGV